MKTDQQRWDKKYRGLPADWVAAPDALLARCTHLLPGYGEALDLACGTGGDLLWLAARKYHVTGIDSSPVALEHCRRILARANLEAALVKADLDDYALPRAHFDLMLMIRYLSRRLIPAIRAALRPGGLVIIKTFNRNHLRRAPRFNPDYLLTPGELHDWFPGITCLASNDDPAMAAATSYWVGRKPLNVQECMKIGDEDEEIHFRSDGPVGLFQRGSCC